MRALLVSLLLAALVPVFVGCDGGPARDRDEGDDDRRRDDLPALDPCTGPTDCSVLEVCFEGLCHRACDETEPCSDPRPLCDLANGACVGCLLAEDCAADEICNAAHECEAQVATTCTPNEIGCLNDATAFVCDGAGAARTEAPCRDDQRCGAGVCISLVCTPSSIVCSGNARVVCNATGTSTDVESCAEACPDGGFGCACIDGPAEASCVPRTCAPEEARCVGNAAQRCASDGLSFGDLEDCGQDSCIAGRCLPSSCTPGESLCEGRVLLECDADGQGYLESTCEQACSATGTSAQCTDQVCAPSTQQCIDGETLSVCNASGSAAVQQLCGVGKYCADGVCQNEVCTPDARVCLGNNVVQCDALGSDEEVIACAPGEGCEAGQCVDSGCVPACGARQCGPDPVCGASCGSCSGTCSSAGVCSVDNDGPLLAVELSWTPTTQNMDLYLTRDPDGLMCIDDACSLHTCTPGNSQRPDWNNDGSAGDGDPLLVAGPASNPERIELKLPGTSLPVLRVAGVNVGPTNANGTAAATSATIRVRLDGAVVATHTRAIPAGSAWKGVALAWNGNGLTVTDAATIAADVACTAPAGTPCITDGECPAGQGCTGATLFGAGTCTEVECVSDDDCTGIFAVACNGLHQCVLPLLSGWQQDCRDDQGNIDTGNCQAGFHCDIFTQACEEACALTSGSTSSCAGVDGCCEQSGAGTCRVNFFPGLPATCQPSIQGP